MNKFYHELSGSKILLVDDNTDNLEVLRVTLERNGYDLAFALNGEEAIRIAREFKPSLILLDIMMPGMDGFETCRRLKNIEKIMDIPIIFISAKSSSQDITKGLQLGGVDYIVKPFHRDEVLARVQLHLNLQNLMRLREKSEKEIKAFAETLEQNNQELKNFISMASHDLQEPLRKISFFSERLQNKSGSFQNDEEKEHLERINNAALRMQTFLEDILELSRITTETNPISKINLKKVISEVLIDLDHSISDKKGTVLIDELPILEGDKFQIRQVFQNLISNSLKFQNTNNPPVIKVFSVLEKNEIWKINIEDNGIGFDQKYANRIFEPFQRLHGKSEFEGTGMGLSICKKIIERHGGSIDVLSQPGMGSTFTINLPKSKV